ncbi:MAG: type II secretion system protein GspG [Victivallales bacterium]|nr:type II secretion system protein GspG [Victivallales bacterium]
MRARRENMYCVSSGHRDLRKLRCFTLIEVLMVCALLAILMGIMVAGYSFAQQRMSEAATIATIEKIATALESYKAKTGYYIQAVGSNSVFYMDTPDHSDLDFTDFLPDYEKMKKTSMVEASPGKYYLVDAYGLAFWYRSPGYHNRGKFDIESAGPDGNFGYSDANHSAVSSADEVADNIKNWGN